MQLLVIDIKQHDPAKNLEIEKKLLTIPDDFYIVRFWLNDPSVFLGKFQKHELEVNLEFLKKNKIPFFYRFTGGGTVYHDLGNLNITFSRPKTNSSKNRFSKNDSHVVTEAIVSSFKKPGFNFTISDRNAVYYEEKKILGSAVALTKDKFLYHASLLVETNLDNLKNSINWEPDYPAKSHKIVKSKHDTVMNLTDLYGIKTDEIKENFVTQIKEIFKPKNTLRILKEDQLEYFHSL